jgi:arylsulfatase A-like enzyme
MSIYPTLCDLAGIAKPEHVTGENIRPLLVDPKAEWTTPALTTHGRNNHAVRTEHWRYIRYADGTDELYDHRTDEYEWTNLAAKPEHAELKKELAAFFPKKNVPALKGAGDVEGDENPVAVEEQRAKRRAKRQAAKAAQSLK